MKFQESSGAVCPQNPWVFHAGFTLDLLLVSLPGPWVSERRPGSSSFGGEPARWLKQRLFSEDQMKKANDRTELKYSVVINGTPQDPLL